MKVDEKTKRENKIIPETPVFKQVSPKGRILHPSAISYNNSAVPTINGAAQNFDYQVRTSPEVQLLSDNYHDQNSGRIKPAPSE